MWATRNLILSVLLRMIFRPIQAKKSFMTRPIPLLRGGKAYGVNAGYFVRKNLLVLLHFFKMQQFFSLWNEAPFPGFARCVTGLLLPVTQRIAASKARIYNGEHCKFGHSLFARKQNDNLDALICASFTLKNHANERTNH